MFSILFVLVILCVLFWIGLKVTGALLAAAVWLFIKVPLAIFFCALGLVLCCTLILIPIGVKCLKLGVKLFLPGV